MASYVDPLTGRQVVVDEVSAQKAAAGPAMGIPATGAARQGAPETPTRTPDSLPASPAGASDAPADAVPGAAALTLSLDAPHVDAEQMDQVLESRERERFYMLPDGTGQSRTVPAGALEPEGKPAPLVAAAAAADGALPVASWRGCVPRRALKTLRLDAGRRHVLSLPVSDQPALDAGYVVPVPPGAEWAEIWAIVRSGGRASPLLGLVDMRGALVAVAYTATTEHKRETPFAYARLGYRVPMTGLFDGQSLVLLDQSVVRRVTGEACVPDGAAPASSGAGSVTLEFLPR